MARDDVDYVALCRDGVFAQEIKPGSFAEALLRGPTPEWLTPLDSKMAITRCFACANRLRCAPACNDGAYALRDSKSDAALHRGDGCRLRSAVG